MRVSWYFLNNNKYILFREVIFYGDGYIRFKEELVYLEDYCIYLSFFEIFLWWIEVVRL